jgi:hypothetical protein
MRLATTTATGPAELLKRSITGGFKMENKDALMELAELVIDGQLSRGKNL